MDVISDAFLLNMAEVSAALVGLFFVGIFFYMETGFRRSNQARDVIEPYFRASTRIVLVLFSIPLGVSLTLVALQPIWSRGLFALLSLGLVAANLDTAKRIRAVAKATRSTALLVNEVLGSVVVAAIIVVPWILGGLHPTREDLVWSILLAFATGFLSICTLILSAFDISRVEAAVSGGRAPVVVHDATSSQPPKRPPAETTPTVNGS